MHMINRLEHLVHHGSDARLRQRYTLSLDCFIHVHFHELEDECQTASWLIIQHLEQRDDVRVRRQPFECLDLSQVIYL